MAGNFSFDQLKKAVSSGEIDTVLACIVDLQGRLAGKRFLAQYFVDPAHDETHGCNYLLAADIDMEPVPGYKAASWSKGYGDFVMKPDLATLRRIPWLEKTALVICDVLDHHTHDDLPHSPRAILRKQVKRLTERGYIGYFASELEFYLFNETYDFRPQEALAGSRHRLALYRRLSDRHHHQGRRRHAPASQRDGCCRHSDRELQGRMGPGPGRDQRALCRGARHGRPPRHPEERRQGDCRVGGQGDFLHVEIQLRARRQLQPHPQFAVER